MTIRHLRIFAAVVDCGTMHAAAQKLYLSQPTITQAVKELEEHYGCLLFERYGRRLMITPAGQELLGYARELLSLYERMEQSMRQEAGRKLLRVGATAILAEQLLVPMISAFERQNPEVRVEVLVDNTQVIVEKILSSELDFGLVEGTVNSADLLSRPVLEDELVLICGAGHPFAARESVPLADLEGQAFVLREPGSGTREQLEAALKSRGITVRAKWVCHSADSILEAVAQGQGLSVLSRRLAEQALSTKKLRILPLRDAELCRTFNLVYHRNKFLSEPVQAFFRLLFAERA